MINLYQIFLLHDDILKNKHIYSSTSDKIEFSIKNLYDHENQDNKHSRIFKKLIIDFRAHLSNANISLQCSEKLITILDGAISNEKWALKCK